MELHKHYILLKEGMIVSELSSKAEVGEGIVFTQNHIYSLIIWPSGEVYYNLNSETEWVIFKTVRQMTPTELLAAKLKYVDKLY